MQWLAGAPQLALYCHGALALFALLSYLGDRRVLTARASLAFLAAQGVTSLGLSAPQSAPTYVFLADCERAGGVDLARVMVGTVSAGGLWSAWFGGTGLPEDAEQIIYPGILAVLLALWAVAHGVGEAHRVGEADGVAGRKRKGGVSAPGDAPMAGAVPAGAAGSRAAGDAQRVLPWRPDKASLLAAVGCVVVASAGCWSVLGPLWYRVAPFYSRFHDPRRMLFLAYVGTIFLAGLGFQSVWGGDRRGRGVRANRRRRIVLRILLTAVVCGGCMGSVWFGKTRIDSKTIRAAEFHLADAEQATGISRGERFFAQDMGMQYSGNYTRGDFGRSLMPSLGALYGFEDVQGYDPFIPWRYALYMRRLNSLPARTVTLFPSHFGLVRSPDSPWLSRFGPMKVRGPVDCQWPFFLPRWAAPGEEFVIPLARPYEVDAGRLGDVRAYLAEGLDAAGKPAGGEMELVFLYGEEAVGSFTLSAPESGEAPEEENAEFLWPEVLPPRGRGHTPAQRAAVGNVRPRGPSPQLADRLLVRNHSQRAGVLLYSLGLPRPAPRFRPAARAGTFESFWKEDFPDRVQVHFVSVRGPEEQRVYERWAMRLPSGSVHVEIAPGQSPPDVPARAVRGWHWQERSANRLEIALSGERGTGGGWLVLGEPFARGWRCRVDGRPTEIRVADTLFRAVPVRDGDRTVEMRYWPPGLTLGLATAGLTFLAMLALVFAERKTGRQRLEAAVEGNARLCYR
ncbi:MAG TPA: YfhO family protein [Sumerlaeia bacterium]|nr:YfhO family protein [Sumerlaeia bacterium]